MAKKIKLKSYKDKRGILTALDKELKFDIKRIYYIQNPKQIRGKHAHKKNIQILISIKGSCEIFVDNGSSKKKFLMNKNNYALILEPKDWHLMKNFSNDCILLILCSEKYDKDDYIT